MGAREILGELKALGTASYRKMLQTHGIPEPFFGVKIGELKKIQKRVKKDYQLALDLYETGNYDARYLAGLVADETRMTKKDLRRWAETAKCNALCEYTVPWVASESAHGHELALEWIESKDERLAVAGWATLGSFVSITDDEELDLAELRKLLQRVAKTIHAAPNFVRYAMNGFVIAVGCYVKDLTKTALETAAKIGPVSVDMPGTECKVPFAPEYIKKVQNRGTIGKKRKMARC